MKTTALVVGAMVAVAAAATPSRAASWNVEASAQATGSIYGPYVGIGYSENRSADSECNGTPGYGCITTADRSSPSKTTAEASATASGYSSGFGPPYDGPNMGYGYAAADLASGELHLRTVTSGVGFALGGAAVGFDDTLHFAVSAPTTIGVHLHVDGSVFYSQTYFSFALQNEGVAGGSNELFANGFWIDGNKSFVSLSSPSATFFSSNTGYDGIGGGWTSLGPRDFVGTFPLNPIYHDVGIDAQLQATSLTSGDGDGFANFADTAAVSLDLPAGVTFTSDSGAFLTAASGAPEPAAWAMLVAGFGAVGMAARRRAVAAA